METIDKGLIEIIKRISKKVQNEDYSKRFVTIIGDRKDLIITKLNSQQIGNSIFFQYFVDYEYKDEKGVTRFGLFSKISKHTVTKLEIYEIFETFGLRFNNTETKTE